jgi:hypothetical protein
MKKLVILVVGLLVIQMLVGSLSASAAPAAQCPGTGCGPVGFNPGRHPGYFPYHGLYSGFSSHWYYRYTYCQYPAYAPYVPAFYWWDYPYYPGCGPYWGKFVK